MSDTVEKQKIKLIISSIKRTLERYHTKKDPVVKYTLIIDKFHVLMDIIVSFLLINLKDLSEDDRKEFESMIEILHNDLNSLEEWVQAPIYSPDHPFFKIQMQNDLDELNNIKK